MTTIDQLQFAIDHHLALSIQTANNKKFTMQPYEIRDQKVFYHFSNGTDGQIRLVNITKTEFESQKDAEQYQQRVVEQRFEMEHAKDSVKNRCDYYLEILQSLKEKEPENSEMTQYLEFRQKNFHEMFQKLFENKRNLLLQYMLGSNRFLAEGALPDDVLLLLQQSNQSQKRCIEAALGNRVSVIEGPPGTGKTTTILSLIANMVWRGQKVLVVSKNNSAINNVAEELAGMDIPEFFIRMGRDKLMRKSGAGLRAKLQKYEHGLEALAQKSEGTDEQTIKIQEIYEKLKILEKRLNQLVRIDNELGDLRNQLRHLEKRREAYDLSLEDNYIVRRPKQSEAAKKQLVFLNHLSEALDADNRIGIWQRMKLLLFYRESLNTFRDHGVYQMLEMEELYLRLRIEELEAGIQEDHMDDLKDTIHRLYQEQYIPLSRNVLASALLAGKKEELLQTIYDAIDKAEQEDRLEEVMKAQKDNLMALYPVILTTVDSVQSNFYKKMKDQQQIDVVIIDEASQCDILSALPLLFLAKRMVVVGDSKQLEAIKGLNESDIKTKVPFGWDYLKHSFLTTVMEIFHPPSNMLMEHYRCDYGIINYCNKFFYDNQLIVYRGASGHALCLVDDDKGKYSEQDNGSFYNDREIVTITKLIEADITNKFIITPFKGQSKQLERHYGDKQCGTIHTFQGKGEKEVYFSTVLNNTEEARRHLEGGHNLFTKELINVAVSRAKERFTMVTDVEFFKKHDENVANLIYYIEAYGERIPDKTVCLFDYLYREMYTYHSSGKSDNPFEEKLAEFLTQYVEDKGNLQMIMKLPLATVVTDRLYLQGNPDIQQFIRNHAHLDYIIYDKRVNRPLLAIELDGKNHKKEEQMERDRKKEAALAHMEIPLFRMKSKEAWEEETLGAKLDEYLLTR